MDKKITFYIEQLCILVCSFIYINTIVKNITIISYAFDLLMSFLTLLFQSQKQSFSFMNSEVLSQLRILGVTCENSVSWWVSLSLFLFHWRTQNTHCFICESSQLLVVFKASLSIVFALYISPLRVLFPFSLYDSFVCCCFCSYAKNLCMLLF